MANTTYYGLYLTDDATESFLSWRNKINGLNDSNMIKIDNALYAKAAHSTSLNLTLSSSGWTGNSAPYTQTLSITGLTAIQNGSIGLAGTATATQRSAARCALLSVGTQNDGTLTIIADGIVPTVDIPVTVILQD